MRFWFHLLALFLSYESSSSSNSSIHETRRPMKANAWHNNAPSYRYRSIYIYIYYKWYIAAAFIVAIEFDVQVSIFFYE